MWTALLVGLTAALGVVVFARGLFPPRPTLASLLRDSADRRDVEPQTALRSLRGRLAVWLIRRLQGESLPETMTHLEATGLDLETYAVDKLNAAIGGGLIIVVIATFRGFARSPLAIILALTIGMIVGYFLPDFELKRKAARRRDEFTDALTAFVTLVSVCVAGGGGINSAMQDAASLGNSWCFEALRQSLSESALLGEPPWNGFGRLGHRMDLVPLTELAGALSLAGSSGARVTETLQARAESARDAALSRALVEAEKRSEKMNTPIGIMLFAWMLILGYPAMSGLIGS